MSKVRIPRKLKKQIPEGLYCYKFLYKTKNGYKIKPCPMFYTNPNGLGDCKFLTIERGHYNGDDTTFDLALNDQCKSCGYNYGLDD